MSLFPHIRYAAKSDIGRKRKNNEDSFGVFPDLGVYCVADGMGGGDDGEVASAATVGALEKYAKEHPLPQDRTYPIDGMTAAIAAHAKYRFIAPPPLRRSGEPFPTLFFNVFANLCMIGLPFELGFARHIPDRSSTQFAHCGAHHTTIAAIASNADIAFLEK